MTIGRQPVMIARARQDKPSRGAGINPANRFERQHRTSLPLEAVDLSPGEVAEPHQDTVVYEEHAREVVNDVKSPDVGMQFSLNPYQGCEHGCVYCYARPTHEYWGFSAGEDFERKIIAKRNAPELLRQLLRSAKWQAAPISMSGNTDCYQPVERKLRLTRQLLEVFEEHRHPVGILTKNALVLRDIDLLKALAQRHLVHVGMSVTSLNEDVRRRLEPRTSTTASRLRTLETLAAAGIPTFAMVAPIVPSLTSHEVPALVKAVADAGVQSVHYTVVRLNGANGGIFRQWLETHYPDRAARIWAAIAQTHGGRVSDSRIGIRGRGEGPVAEQIKQLFHLARRKYLSGRSMPALELTLYRKAPEIPTLF